MIIQHPRRCSSSERAKRPQSKSLITPDEHGRVPRCPPSICPHLKPLHSGVSSSVLSEHCVVLRLLPSFAILSYLLSLSIYLFSYLLLPSFIYLFKKKIIYYLKCFIFLNLPSTILLTNFLIIIITSDYLKIQIWPSKHGNGSFFLVFVLNVVSVVFLSTTIATIVINLQSTQASIPT